MTWPPQAWSSSCSVYTDDVQWLAIGLIHVQYEVVLGLLPTCTCKIRWPLVVHMDDICLLRLCIVNACCCSWSYFCAKFELEKSRSRSRDLDFYIELDRDSRVCTDLALIRWNLSEIAVIVSALFGVTNLALPEIGTVKLYQLAAVACYSLARSAPTWSLQWIYFEVLPWPAQDLKVRISHACVVSRLRSYRSRFVQTMHHWRTRGIRPFPDIRSRIRFRIELDLGACTSSVSLQDHDHCDHVFSPSVKPSFNN